MLVLNSDYLPSHPPNTSLKLQIFISFFSYNDKYDLKYRQMRNWQYYIYHTLIHKKKFIQLTKNKARNIKRWARAQFVFLH